MAAVERMLFCDGLCKQLWILSSYKLLYLCRLLSCAIAIVLVRHSVEMSTRGDTSRTTNENKLQYDRQNFNRSQSLTPYIDNNIQDYLTEDWQLLDHVNN